MSQSIEVTSSGHVATIELRRPPSNYFDREMLSSIADAAQNLHRDGVRAIVLCAAGRHFCAGADFATDDMADNREESAALLYAEAVRLLTIPVPVIAAVQGSAVGGGVGLACAADFRVASPASRFHANFSSLGFHHGFALSVTLPEIVGTQHAADLLYASRRVDGQRAYDIGLVDRLVPDGEQRAEAVRWAQEIATRAPLAVQSMKQTLRAPLVEKARAALEREHAEQARLWATRDSAIGIAANLARETPVFTGR
ncbi:enoyl-CoA hydratase/isomerase family protein [Mumia sp. Pv 4-285]|uniref:enoyl-CoA hydratase/isomerase family protein n=1 Tax=Mumia qirimensis TaxID=3234852 RepID=UPI00351D1A90